MRVNVGEIGHAHLVENVQRAGAPFRRRPVLEAEDDVIDNRQMGKQREILKQQANGTFFRGHVDDPVREHPAVDGYATFLQFLKPCEKPKHGRFTAAGRTQQGQNFTRPDIQTHILQDRRSIISVADILHMNAIHGVFRIHGVVMVQS